MTIGYEYGALMAVKEAMDKEAFLGLGALFGGARAALPAARAALPTFRSALQAGGGWGKAVLSPMRMQMGQGFSSAAKTIGTAFNGPGGGVGKGLLAAARSPLGKEMAISSGITGGINALQADKGDKMRAFMRGAGYGALGGVATKGLTSAASAFRSTAPMQSVVKGTGVKNFTMRNLTRPGLIGGAATMALPTGAKDVTPPGLPMSNIPGVSTL